jgi:hypothetical protein
MGLFPTGMMQSWLPLILVVLSQLFTLLFIGGIARALRRNGRGPLGQRSARRAGRLSCSVQYWMVASAIVGLILLSPIIVFLMVICAEMLIDLLIEAGTTAVSAVGVGAVGWVLVRKFWPPPDKAPQSGPGLVSDETAIAAPPL